MVLARALLPPKNFDEIYKHRVDYWKKYDQAHGMMLVEEEGDFNDG